MDFQLEQFQLCDWQRIVLEIFCEGQLEKIEKILFFGHVEVGAPEPEPKNMF